MAFQPQTHFESDEYLRLLREISVEPDISRRELSRRLDLSLGKTNYLLQAVTKKGLVKVENFNNSCSEIQYTYLLTPAGVEERGRATVRFLTKRMDEFENLEREIAFPREETHEPRFFARDCQAG